MPRRATAENEALAVPQSPDSERRQILRDAVGRERTGSSQVPIVNNGHSDSFPLLSRFPQTPNASFWGTIPDGLCTTTAIARLRPKIEESTSLVRLRSPNCGICELTCSAWPRRTMPARRGIIQDQLMSVSEALPPARAPFAGPANAATEHSRRCRWRRHIRPSTAIGRPLRA